MPRPILLRHGEHTKPEYLSRAGTSGSAGRSTDQDRPVGGADGIVVRYRKGVKASDKATALALTKALYPHAIEYIGIRNQLRGVMLLSVGFCAIGLIIGGIHFLREAINPGVFLSACASGLLLFGLYLLLMAIRHDLYRPHDEPIIFDRRRRKVYRLFRESQPGFLGLLLGWPMCAVEYDWDLVDAEHWLKIINTGNGAQRRHTLAFLVRKSTTDPTIIDSFNLSFGMELNDTNVAQLWEHTRRFMEANGPHLPAGESLVVQEAPKSLWQCMGVISPFGPRFVHWWKSSPLGTIMYLLVSPIVLPVFIVWGSCYWLSVKTSYPAEWPAEVMREVTRP